MLNFSNTIEMKKSLFILYKLYFLFFIFAGCSIIPSSSSSWAERTLNDLSLREKIAQMMIYRMNMRLKDVPSLKWKKIMKLIEGDGIGGIHLWYGDAATSLLMMNEMQESSKVPIIFDADIEYGLNQRFPMGTDLPPLMAIAATNNPENAYEVGKIVAKESRSVGVHWNFSPVADVNNNPLNPIINVRSFSEDPDIVSEFGIQYMKGLQDHGMLATAKHFPGHGDTETDSHSSLAMIPSDSLRLWSIEIPPFQALIDSDIDAVMIAHVHAPDYQPDSDTPASMSPFWVNNILKNKIGFKGAIVTDGMGMGGITKNYSDAYALIEVVKAGCDIIIQNYDIIKSINTIERAVVDGIISEERINESALKMLNMKEKIGLHRSYKVSLDQIHQNLAHASHKEIARKIASEAITCVINDNNLIPMQHDLAWHVIDLYDNENNHTLSSITKGLKTSGMNVKSFQVDASDSDKVLMEIIKEIPKESHVLINTFVGYRARKDKISLPDNLTTFIINMAKRTNNLILGSLGNPYIIQDFPQIQAYVCAYKNNSLMKNAYLEALLGKRKINGKLPVSIPGIARIGEGVSVNKIEMKKNIVKYKPGKDIKQVMPYELNVDNESLINLMDQAINEKAWPGGVLLASKDGKIFIHAARGYHTYDRKRKMQKSDIFDLASITKVIATTSSVMKLYDDKVINLDDPVIKYLPEFKGKKEKHFEQKSKINLRNLLTHTSGLPPFRQYFLIEGSLESRLDSIFNTEPVFGIEDTTIYSDVGIIILGKIVEKISGISLDQYSKENIFIPLGMNTTFYNPPRNKKHRIVPTEIDIAGNLIKGYVHDENAHSLEGVAGHAGLFSTAKDLAIFSQMMLNEGIYGWKRIFHKETVKLFTTNSQIMKGSSRCLGWDSPSGKASGGVYLSSDSFGHTGFTGTSLWIDPTNQITVVLLTNAVHPKRSNKSPGYFDWRQRIHSAVYETLQLNDKNQNLEWRREW